MESKDLSSSITGIPKSRKVTKKPAKGCKCKENLLAALNIRGDISKGNKDKLRQVVEEEMK